MRLTLLILLLLAGCGRSDAPDAIWMTVGREAGEVVYPRAIACDRAHDWFYVIDRNARIQHLDRDGKTLSTWDTPAWTNGKPTGCTVGPDGNLWVADTHYSRILVYAPTGELLHQFGKEGDGPGEFRWPTDLAFDSAGRIYISEYNGHDRIQVFAPFKPSDTALTPLFDFGRFGDEPGEFSRPQALAIRGDDLFVVDTCNHRIEVFGLDGTYRRMIGSVGGSPGQFRFPWGLDLDLAGNLIVTEYGGNRVQKLSPDGTPIATWGRNGVAPGELLYPWSGVVDSTDRTVVIDSGNNRLQVFRFGK
ncbi:MAG: hypothetical protein QM770_11725 [Tepidisphaeraceae bacterium]